MLSWSIWLLQQITVDWVASTTNTYFSQFWRLKSEVRVPAWSGSGKNPLPGCRLPTSHWLLTGWEKSRLALCPLLVSAPIPFTRGPPS